MEHNKHEFNKKLAETLRDGVIMDVQTPEQAKIAEKAGACAVMALERIPADIRVAGGVSRMSDPKMTTMSSRAWTSRRRASGCASPAGASSRSP